MFDGACILLLSHYLITIVVAVVGPLQSDKTRPKLSRAHFEIVRLVGHESLHNMTTVFECLIHCVPN